MPGTHRIAAAALVLASAGDRKGWRPPTAEELTSLRDATAPPPGHPFEGKPPVATPVSQLAAVLRMKRPGADALTPTNPQLKHWEKQT